jgi:hypothetical protein
MKKANMKKVLSLVLAFVLCAVMLVGCKKDADGEAKEEYKGYLYSAVPTSDKESSINPLTDALTGVIANEVAKYFELSDDQYVSESHVVVADKDVDGNKQLLVLRSPVYVYSPVTGEFADAENGYDSIAVVTLKAEGEKYTAESYEECFVLDSERAEALVSKVTDKTLDEAIKDCGETTPYRYVKDDKIYLVDDEKYVNYGELLVAQVLTNEKQLETYDEYIKTNKAAYDKLVAAPQGAKYIIGEFLKGDNNTPKGYVMYRAMMDILEANGEKIPYYDLNGQEEAQRFFKYYLGIVLTTRATDGHLSVSYKYPTGAMMLEMHDKTLSDEEFIKQDFLYDAPVSITVTMGENEVVFEKGSEKYYEIFKMNQYLNVSTSDAKEIKKNVSVDDVMKYTSSNLSVHTEAYITYNYVSGKSIVFANAGQIFMISDLGDGKYNAYRTGVGDNAIVELLESCF